jgi:hypothetical protein
VTPEAPVQQRDFHDTREVAVAESAGLKTTAGVPLSPAAIATLRDLDKATAALRSWADFIDSKLKSLPKT